MDGKAVGRQKCIQWGISTATARLLGIAWLPFSLYVLKKQVGSTVLASKLNSIWASKSDNSTISAHCRIKHPTDLGGRDLLWINWKRSIKFDEAISHTQNISIFILFYSCHVLVQSATQKESSYFHLKQQKN